MRGKIDLSQLRKTMWELNRKRGLLQRKLHRPSRMIIGSILEVWKRCSNRECRCYKRNERHGPYLYLMEPHEGKHTTRHVRRKDWARVKEGVERYRQFQQGLAEIRKINEAIFDILKSIRDSHLERYE